MHACMHAGLESKCTPEGDECAGHALVLGALLLLQDEPSQLVHAVSVELHACKAPHVSRYILQ